MWSHRFLLCVCTLLLACSPGQSSDVQELPSEEVLSLAAQATKKMISAQYTAAGTFNADNASGDAIDGKFRMDGVLQDSGEQMRFQMDLDADFSDRSGSYNVDSTLEVVSISEDEVYMNLHSITVNPNCDLFRPELIGKIAGQWWRLPADDSLPISGEVAPDPKLLHAQSQIITVTKSLGIDTIGSSNAYHYEVELDKKKLLAYLAASGKDTASGDIQEIAEDMKNVVTNGEIWIDTETYFMHKISWSVSGLPISTGTASAEFVIDFRNHNAAPEIVPPTSAKIFSPLILLSNPQLDLEFENSLQDMDDSDELLDELIRTMNGN
ncbi:MAG: hypothetical protein QF442_00485 [Candidatus Peribacteraceae bacterium]|jgi:hypothetical protein|nr:hypothetical protein [Candidatus Peribacteraceae bacterium]